MKAVVFDVDGVLVDPSGRFKACLEEAGLKDLRNARGHTRKIFWDCFLSDKYIHLDRIRTEMVELAKDYARRGYKIIIITGRPRTMREATLSQLREAGLENVEAFFRKPGDHRSDGEYKIEALRKVLEKWSIEIVYDDSENVIEAIKRELPEIKTIPINPP